MKKNYLAEALVGIADEDMLYHARMLDEHLRMQWTDKASPDFHRVLEAFESKLGDNAAAEFTVYLLLTEAMLDDVRTQQGSSGV